MAKLTRYENEEGVGIECYKNIEGRGAIMCGYISMDNVAYIFDDAEELQEFIDDLIKLHKSIA